MTLNPDDVETQVFREKMRGYDQDEVDAFLDKVADRLRQLAAERDELVERIGRIQDDATESMDTERLLKRTLIMAQRTADQAVADANEQAETTTADADRYAAEVVSQAERKVAELTEDAERRAAETTGEAERRASELLDDARREAEYARDTATAELESVHRAVAELQRFRAEYRERVHAVIAEQLDAFDRAGELPDLPPGLVDVAREADETLARSELGPRRLDPVRAGRPPATRDPVDPATRRAGGLPASGSARTPTAIPPPATPEPSRHRLTVPLRCGRVPTGQGRVRAAAASGGASTAVRRGPSPVIAAALVLVVAGAVALVVGLVSGDALVWGYVTIGCCLLAGALLFAGVRRSRPQREPVVQSGGHGHGAAWGGASDRTGGPAGDRDERVGAEVHAGGRSAGDDAATARAFGGDDGLAWAPPPAEDDEPPAASADVGDPDDPLRPVDGGMQPPVVAVAVDPGAVPDAPPVPAEPAAAGPAAAGPAADQATGAAQSPPADGSPRLF